MSKQCLITGSSSGIGKQLSLDLLEKGYSVIGLSRTQSFEHKNYTHFSVDLSKPKDYLPLFNDLKKEISSLRALFCNAGKGLFGHLEEFSQQSIRETFEVNTLSQIALIRTFLPLFKKQSEGDIFIMGSKAGLQGKKEGSIYCASKFALRGFAQALREETASQSIRVTLIAPGFVDSPFYQNLHFSPMEGKPFALDIQDISQVMLGILESPNHIHYDEVLLNPQHHSIQKH